MGNTKIVNQVVRLLCESSLIVEINRMFLNVTQREVRIRLGVFSFLLVLLGVGAWLRLRHLGALSLVVDEGLQALAVQGILDHGVPKVDSGYVYLRAPLFLYMQAAFAKLFGVSPFWLRFPSMLFGVAAIIPSYVMGKMLFNRQIGLLTATIMAFSVWEIELSRYGRFYTTFQFMYLITLLCFYRGFMLDVYKYKIWFLIAAFITFSTHSMSQLLATCFLIPLFLNSYSISRKLFLGLWAIGFVFALKLYQKLVQLLTSTGDTLRYVPGEDHALPDVFEKLRLMAGLPPMFRPDLSIFSQMLHHDPPELVGLALILGAATVYLIYQAFQGKEIRKILFAIVMIWMGFMHQFALLLVVLMIYLLLFAHDFRCLGEPILRVVYGAAAICLGFWFFVMLSESDVGLRQTVLMTFGFPHFYQYFMHWLIMGWPLMTIIFGLGCILLLAQYVVNRNDPVPIFLLGVIFFPAVVASFFRAYHEARYIFHLYPGIIIVFAMMMVRIWTYIQEYLTLKRLWSRRLVAFAMLLLTVLMSQDANPAYAWSIGNRTYQSAKDPIRSVISWEFYAGFHQDHESPSLYVRDNISPEDYVVAFGPIHMIGLYHFYVGKLDYAVAPSSTPFNYGALREGKIVNYITGSELLSGVEQFKQFVEAHPGHVWILGDRQLLADENSFYAQPMKVYLRSLVHDPDYVGLDRQTFAVKVR